MRKSEVSLAEHVHLVWCGHNVAQDLGILVAGLHGKVDGFRVGVRVDGA